MYYNLYDLCITLQDDMRRSTTIHSTSMVYQNLLIYVLHCTHPLLSFVVEVRQECTACYKTELKACNKIEDVWRLRYD